MVGNQNYYYFIQKKALDLQPVEVLCSNGIIHSAFPILQEVFKENIYTYFNMLNSCTLAKLQSILMGLVFDTRRQHSAFDLSRVKPVELRTLNRMHSITGYLCSRVQFLKLARIEQQKLHYVLAVKQIYSSDS